MRENVIEKALVKAVKKRCGLAIKFNSVGYNGVPDRIILLPKGIIIFIELKAPGKQMQPLQEKRNRQLESLGFQVFCLDSLEGIEVILDAVQTA